MPFPTFSLEDHTFGSSFWFGNCWTGTRFVVADVNNEQVLISSTGAPGSWSSVALTNFSGWEVAGKDGNIVIVGSLISSGAGAVRRSVDGGSSFSNGTIANESWRGVTTNGSGRFVAVNNSGANAAATSDNVGQTWTLRALSSTKNWQDVIWSGTHFVAVGSNSYSRSTDGITWSSPTAFPSGTFYTNIESMGNGMLIATESDYYSLSLDHGASWTSYAMPGGSGGAALAAAEGMALIIKGGPYDMHYTLNGITWLAGDAPGAGNDSERGGSVKFDGTNWTIVIPMSFDTEYAYAVHPFEEPPAGGAPSAFFHFTFG